MYFELVEAIDKLGEKGSQKITRDITQFIKRVTQFTYGRYFVSSDKLLQSIKCIKKTQTSYYQDLVLIPKAGKLYRQILNDFLSFTLLK